MRKIRLGAAALLCLILAGPMGTAEARSGDVVPAGRAAAVSCTYKACDNKGPVSQNCDDDGNETLNKYEYGAYGLTYVSLMYSPACHAYWARGKSLNTGEDQGVPDPAGYDIRVEKRLISTNALLYQHVAHVYSNTSAYEWTNMAGRQSGKKVRACYRVPANHSGDGAWHCTIWRSN